MKKFFAYHVVTDKPMQLGQRMMFDDTHRNGVWQRVRDKIEIVNEIYAEPDKNSYLALEHHTAVALRELALEEIRQKLFPEYPSRMACLYVSDNLNDAEMWADLFIRWGRPTFQIVKLKITGNCFTGDANNCFNGTAVKSDNLAKAEHYWRNLPNTRNENPIREIIVNGKMEVEKIIKEINADL